jgi:hemerythrin-like metal-binding protein
MRIQWTPAHAVGIDDVDRLQRDFFSAADRLTRATTSPDVVFEAALRSLLEISAAQFSAEERWLREAGDPSLARHELEHRRFLADLATYANHVAGGRRATVDALHLSSFIADWVAAHVSGADRDLARAARAATPEERRARMKLVSG